MVRSRQVALSISVFALALGCDDSTGPQSSGAAVFEGDWTAPVHGSIMTLRIGEFGSWTSSEGEVLWDTYVGRLSCGYRVDEDPSLQCSIIGLDNPEGGGACIPAGREFPYVDIKAADSSTIRALVGGEQHFAADPCVDNPQLSWEPPVDVEFRRP